MEREEVKTKGSKKDKAFKKGLNVITTILGIIFMVAIGIAFYLSGK